MSVSSLLRWHIVKQIPIHKPGWLARALKKVAYCIIRCKHLLSRPAIFRVLLQRRH